jgi:hypothetical protein
MLLNLFKILLITVAVPAFSQDKLTDTAPNETLNEELIKNKSISKTDDIIVPDFTGQIKTFISDAKKKDALNKTGTKVTVNNTSGIVNIAPKRKVIKPYKDLIYFVGSYPKRNNLYAEVLFKGNSNDYLIGDNLPNGYKLKDITATYITVSRSKGGGRTNIYLTSTETAKTEREEGIERSKSNDSYLGY